LEFFEENKILKYMVVRCGMTFPRACQRTGRVGSILYFRISQVPTDRAKLTAITEWDENRPVELVGFRDAEDQP
jgi:hypothetical protein